MFNTCGLQKNFIETDTKENFQTNHGEPKY